MQSLYSLFFIIVVFGVATQILYDIPNQYTSTSTYQILNLDESVDSDECYDLEVGLFTIVGGVSGYPNLSEIEDTDYRENMTATIKMEYAGFELDAHPNDKVWAFDEDDKLVEINQPFSDPFSLGGQLLFLNIKGEFTKYDVKLIYYSGFADQYFTVENAFQYESNKILGEPLEPHIIELAPLVITVDDHQVSAEIISDDYAGGLCLEVILMDCNGFEIESDTYCYELGERDCPNLLMVNQSDFNAISNAVFRASSVVISASKVKGNRNVTLSAMDSIVLNPGFEVRLGSSMMTDSIGCN